MKNILYTIILSYLFSFSVNSEIYKTIDEDGNIDTAREKEITDGIFEIMASAVGVSG